jgi:hypothetical protein
MKKGQIISNVPSKMLKWVIMGVVWGVSLIFLVILMSNYKAAVIYFPPQVEDNLLAYRFLYAPGCIAYQDDTGRTYAGVIDWSKLEADGAETVNRCYSAGATSKAPGFRIVAKKSSGDSRSIETNNFGSAEPNLMLTKPVLINDGEELVAGEVEFFIREIRE